MVEAKRLDFNSFFEQNGSKIAGSCAARSTVSLLVADRYEIPTSAIDGLTCGQVRARHHLRRPALDSFYRHYFREFYGKGTSGRNDKVQARLESGKQHVFSVVRPHFKGGLVYEWGASGSWNLEHLAREGASVEGFDLDIAMAALAKDRFGIHVNELMDSLSVPQDRQPADLLIVNHVLEHVQDPLGLIRKLRVLLKEEGILFIGLPVFESANAWGFRNFFHIAHIHYFSFEWFRKCILQLGFEFVQGIPSRGILILRKLPDSAVSDRITYPRQVLRSFGLFLKLFLTEGHVVYYWKRFRRLQQRVAT